MPDVSAPITRLDEKFQKVALFGGVYNNHYGLWAAIRTAQKRGTEAMFCLGDLGGFGPNPNKVFPLLNENKVRVIQGNYEESLVNRIDDCGCGYTHPKDNRFAQISYDYTNARLTDDNRAWLATLPKQLQFKLGEKTVHLCHGSPRRINEFLWETTTSSGYVRSALNAVNADILACTHTGIPWKREVGSGQWIVNVGVLGRPANDGNTHVWYAELSVLKDGVTIEFVPVYYDWSALAKEMEEEKLPPEFIETIRTGYWTSCLEILPAKERAQGRF